MMSLDSIKSALIALETCRELTEGTMTFEEYAANLVKIGVVRMTFDAIKNEAQFYTTNQLVHGLFRDQLVVEQVKNPWHLGTRLDGEALESAIAALDSRKIDSIEFHRKIYAAGVVFCHVFFLSRKIYYIGIDGAYYLENYQDYQVHS